MGIFQCHVSFQGCICQRQAGHILLIEFVANCFFQNLSLSTGKSDQKNLSFCDPKDLEVQNMFDAINQPLEREI